MTNSVSLKNIVEEYKLELLVYFGSFKTEYYNKDSDIDIAYLSKYNLDINDKMKLLEDLIIYHRKSEIDLVDLRTAEPILKYEIGINGRVLFEKEEGLFEKYSSYYIKKIYELKPIIDYKMKKLSDKVREVLDCD